MLDGEDKIIQDAVSGEASAFGLLYDHYQPRLYRFVLIKVSHREEAEDLTHQVFVNAWQNIRSYEERGYPFSSWLYQIARNIVIDHYRTRKSAVPIEELGDAEPASASDHEAETEMKLALDRVRSVIRTLKPLHQDVLILRFVEDLPLKDVALALRKSEGAVKLIQHRALKKLKIGLDNENRIAPWTSFMN